MATKVTISWSTGLKESRVYEDDLRAETMALIAREVFQKAKVRKRRIEMLEPIPNPLRQEVA